MYTVHLISWIHQKPADLDPQGLEFRKKVVYTVHLLGRIPYVLFLQAGFSPLYMAAQEGKVEVVKLLLSHGANPALSTTVSISLDIVPIGWKRTKK